MLDNFLYNKKELKIIENKNIKKDINKKSSYLWIKATNIANEEMDFLKEIFNFHPTTIEDILSKHTRVKYEEFEEYTLIVFKGIKEIKGNYAKTYNLSFIMGENFIVTFNEEANEIIEELSKNHKKIENFLRKGEDYIAHYIFDKEVDRYLRIKIESGENLKEIEKEFMKNQDKETLKKIFSKELILLELRHLSESITDLCLDLTKPADNFIHNELIPYFRDVYDHSFKTAEGYKSMLERVNGMKNMHSTVISMRTNEIIKALTIIMAIMMPLTVITGFYGMNISLPLQEYSNSWMILIIIMFGISLMMYFIFDKLKSRIR